MVNVSQDYVSNGMTYVPENFLEDILNEMEKASLEQLHQAKSKLKSAGINPETVHLKGDPGFEILNYARETEQQLIIIGSRGLRGVKGMMAWKCQPQGYFFRYYICTKYGFCE
ncbi:universal stress protein [Paenibacillus vini]|uniref:universal stress protein n=1 Tax=Paenibacillus vini TaxID=1476024 RepID=UPI0025B71FA1|nr:universal stress protein [Paenibacillus vini]MDN4070992.1 universal stress protein [Paenibacillus vini]